MGVAFDGDGDRAIFVDASGEHHDGDAVLLGMRQALEGGGRLKRERADCRTVMSNIGLGDRAASDSGIEFLW